MPLEPKILYLGSIWVVSIALAVMSTNILVYSFGGSVCLRQLHNKLMIASLPRNQK